MDRVTVEMLDDDYAAAEDEERGPDLAREPTNVSVRYLMGLGMTEMDARHLVAVAKGEIGGSVHESNTPATRPGT
jgi:hypothetical protein